MSRRNQIGFAKLSHHPITQRVQFEFILNPAGRSQGEEFLTLGERRIPMALIRNPRARLYVLRLRPDGSAS